MRYSLPKLYIPFVLAIALTGCHSRGLQRNIDVGTANDVAGLRAASSDESDYNTAPRLHPLSPEDSANIARVTAQIMEHRHYLQGMNHKEISDRMFQLYLESLDPLHYYLLQSDIDGFAANKSGLYDKVLDNGDTGMATQIYTRYLERFDEANAAVTEALNKGEFTFNGADSINTDRKNTPAPKNLEEAKAQWLQRLRYEYLQEKLTKAKPADIIQTLKKRYTRISRTVHENDSDDILERYLNAIAHAYDPHSDYFGRVMTQRFNDEMQLSLVGIGASLQDDDDGYCKIMSLLPGGPAIRSGKFHVGDRIVAVAQGDGEPVDCIEMKTDKIVSMIRGKKGTEVRITVIPAGADIATRKTYALMRDEVKLEEKEATAEIIDEPQADGKIVRMGYVNLPSFYADFSDNSATRKSTTADVAKLIRKLEAEKMKGLILDLRNNGGGSLDEVKNLTGLFVKRPAVVQVKSSANTVKVLRPADAPVLYDGPMIVLTNKYSASASEILAGALQDYGRAVIVGDSSTFGKGSVQTIEQLGPLMEQLGAKPDTDPGELKYTIEKFYRPSGSSTQLRGVASDIVIPSITNITDEYSETKLEYSMKWDTVPPCQFDKTNMVQPYLADLQKRSANRIAKDADFAILRKVLDEDKRAIDEKVISLNEQVRQKEKQDQDSRLNGLKKEFKALPAPKEKVYKFTLKQADLPGMPPLLDPKKEAPKDPTEATDDQPDPTASVLTSDMTLEETERILLDMIGLTPHATTASR